MQIKNVQESSLLPAAIPSHLINESVTYGIGYRMIDIR